MGIRGIPNPDCTVTSNKIHNLFINLQNQLSNSNGKREELFDCARYTHFHPSKIHDLLTFCLMIFFFLLVWHMFGSSGTSHLSHQFLTLPENIFEIDHSTTSFNQLTTDYFRFNSVSR